MHTDETQLLVRTCRGDEAAARALWELHGPPLVAYARAILGPAQGHLAEDVVQNVMCSILRTPQKSLRQVREVRMWLSTITRRLCLNTLRSAGRQRRKLTRFRGGAALDAAEASAEGVGVTGLPPAPEVVRAMDSLPRRLREVVYLKHIGSLTFDQIATSLGRNRSTLATQYQSGIALLREMLAHSDRTISAPPASIGVGP